MIKNDVGIGRCNREFHVAYLGERLDFAAVASGALPGQETQGTVTGRFELQRNLNEAASRNYRLTLRWLDEREGQYEQTWIQLSTNLILKEREGDGGRDEEEKDEF
jgi:hypothetical protein